MLSSSPVPPSFRPYCTSCFCYLVTAPRQFQYLIAVPSTGITKLKTADRVYFKFPSILVQHLQTAARVPSLKIFIGRNANGQPLPLKAQAELFCLLLPCLRHCCLADSMCLNTNFKGGFPVQYPHHFTQGSNDVVEGMDFVVVKDYTPQFLFFLLFFSFGFCLVFDDGLDPLFGGTSTFAIRHEQLG
jgi:hypothetical protein